MSNRSEGSLIDHTAELQESCRIIEAAAAKRLSSLPPGKPLLTFSLTEEQREDLAFAALCQAEKLEEGYESDELEVQDAIRNLWSAYDVLEGGRHE